MPCDDWLHCHCYKRRTILGLALLPLLAGPARAAEEGEADKPLAPDAQLPSQSGDPGEVRPHRTE